jgi:hypothetical protein
MPRLNMIEEGLPLTSTSTCVGIEATGHDKQMVCGPVFVSQGEPSIPFVLKRYLGRYKISGRSIAFTRTFDIHEMLIWTNTLCQGLPRRISGMKVIGLVITMSKARLGAVCAVSIFVTP